jgi:hypothetical protein
MGRHVEREYERLLAAAYGKHTALSGRIVMRRISDAKQHRISARSFDAGEPVAVEYDVAAANPKFDARRYAEVPTARAYSDASVEEPDDASEPTEAPEAEPAEASEGEPVEAPEAEPAEAPEAEAEESSADAPAIETASDEHGPATSDVETPPSEELASATSVRGELAAPRPRPTNRYTQRRMEELVQDSDVLSDIQSILDAKSAPEARALSAPPRPDPPAPRPAPAPKAEENGHSIFEEIAAKMRYAHAYDLGAVELAQRFDAFDSGGDERSLPVDRPRADALARHFDRIESLPGTPRDSGSQSKG